MISSQPGRHRWVRVAVALAGLAALAGYLVPGLVHPGATWPLWDVRVYWWGGRQAARGAVLYGGAGQHDFTYPPFAAAVFGTGAGAPASFLKILITAASATALPLLCWLSLGAAGVRRRPEIVLAVTALALFAVPVRYTLHLGEVNIILAALVGTDLLRRRDGGWWQGIATGLAAGIKLTPLIFVVYLLVTGRVRAGITAAGTFAATIAVGFVLLPSASRAFWLHVMFLDQRRIGDPANPADQSLSGLVARAAGAAAAPSWWLAAALLTGLAGLVIAAWAHRRGHRLGGVVCCGTTALLVSPISWTHHWVWSVPLLVALTVTAWRRRSPWFALAAVAAAIVFSGLIPVPWRGTQPSPARSLADDLYVLCGLAVLAGAAFTLAAERAATAGWPGPRWPAEPAESAPAESLAR